IDLTLTRDLISSSMSIKRWKAEFAEPLRFKLGRRIKHRSVIVLGAVDSSALPPDSGHSLGQVGYPLCARSGRHASQSCRRFSLGAGKLPLLLQEESQH